MLDNKFFQPNNSNNSNDITFNENDGDVVVFGSIGGIDFTILIIMFFNANLFHDWII